MDPFRLFCLASPRDCVDTVLRMMNVETEMIDEDIEMESSGQEVENNPAELKAIHGTFERENNNGPVTRAGRYRGNPKHRRMGGYLPSVWGKEVRPRSVGEVERPNDERSGRFMLGGSE
jgi:hypothetical protein